MLEKEPVGKLEKHIEIVNSLRELNNSIRMLEDLRDHIVGGVISAIEEIVGKQAESPPLAEVLEGTPLAIRNQAERIVDLCKIIRDGLF